MSNSLKISLAIITTEQDMEKAKNAVLSVKDYVDEVCVTIADKKPSEAKIDGCKMSYFEWCDDFSKAREYNFSQCTGDWILWLDSDDTLQGVENLRKNIEQADENNITGLAFLYKYGFDENGNCVDEHWKVQAVKNNGKAEWRGAIHEDLTQKVASNWGRVSDVVRIHHTDEERAEKSYERNLRILLKEHEKDPKEPRTMFYLGRTYIASGKYQEAIDILMKYLTLSGWDEERYEATLLIGQCFFANNQLDEALKWYNTAILEKEDYPDAYIQKGMVYLKKEEFAKALINFESAIIKEKPEANTYFNPMTYSRDLVGSMAVCYMHTGKFDKAVEYAEHAVKVDPNHEKSKELLKITRGIKSKIDLAKQYKVIASLLESKGEEDKIKTLLHSVPSDLLDNPYITGLRNKFNKPKKWKEKSIAVYCGNSPETWNPNSLDEGGIGGSETAVIEICKRLAKKGWKITVYNHAGAKPEGDDFDGVTYKNYWDFNFKDEFDVLWVWRLPEMFDYPIKARMAILDLHDVMNPLDFSQDRLDRIDKIFVKTNYHRSLLPNIADEKFEVIGNGINLEKFEGEEKKEPYRFIYSSTPNRGLDIILESMWDKIKEELPEAELHTYYGFNTFYQLEKNNPERMAWMHKMEELMKKPGVVNHGRVGQAELHKDQLKSSLWLYPTYFPEIHCITACEMQAAGVIPVTSGYAALEETQKVGLKLEGDVYDPEWQENYVKEVVKLAKDKKRLEELRIKAKSEARQFSWELVATNWDKKLCG
jgi:tetratricopeptide (TPR) repeat protein